ncbi:MAG: hypothetical protein U1E65_27120 [Myxococcota bacterium]
MKKLLLLTALAATTAATALVSTPATAQSLSLRLGADLDSIVYFPEVGDLRTIGDAGWIGINIVPGLRLAKILTLEVGLSPKIPINTDFAFGVSPGVLVDLFLIYARGGATFIFGKGDPGTELNLAAGLSFLGSGYLGVTLNYSLSGIKSVAIGAEVGWRMDFDVFGNGGSSAKSAPPPESTMPAPQQGSTPPPSQPAQPENSTITP